MKLRQIWTGILAALTFTRRVPRVDHETRYTPPQTLDDFEQRATKEKKRRSRLAEIAGMFRSAPTMYPQGVKLHYVHAGHRHRARVVNRTMRRALAAKAWTSVLPKAGLTPKTGVAA